MFHLHYSIPSASRSFYNEKTQINSLAICAGEDSELYQLIVRWPANAIEVYLSKFLSSHLNIHGFRLQMLCILIISIRSSNINSLTRNIAGSRIISRGCNSYSISLSNLLKKRYGDFNNKSGFLAKDLLISLTAS